MLELMSVLLVVSTSVGLSVGVSYVGLRGVLTFIGPLGGTMGAAGGSAGGR